MLISEIEVDPRTLFAAANSAQNLSNDSHLGASITIKMIIWFAFLSFAKLVILIKMISWVYIQKKTSEGGGRGSRASRHPDTHNPALFPGDDRRLIFIFCCRRNATLLTHTIVTFEHFSVAQKLFQVQCSALKFGFPWKYFCLNSCSNNKSQIVKKCLFNQEICICNNPKTNKHNILLMK